MTECRLLIDPPCPGPWNMAVDEVLLDWAAEQGGCCWRFYGWHEPTLSLGYFQSYDDRRQHTPSTACRAVRRLTGGGAILHDIELTYSIVVPAGHPLAAARDALYQAVHGALIDLLGDLGLSARLCQPRDSLHAGPVGQGEEPFLCFQRRAPGDVLVGDTKVCGSAQRRRRGAVLQHGSVLLGQSAAAPELPGLAELTGNRIAADTFSEAWLTRLSGHLQLTWRPAPLTPAERADATAQAEIRYAASAWTEERSR